MKYGSELQSNAILHKSADVAGVKTLISSRVRFLYNVHSNSTCESKMFNSTS